MLRVKQFSAYQQANLKPGGTIREGGDPQS